MADGTKLVKFVDPTIQAPQTEGSKKVRPALRGIRGWLGLYVWTLLIFGPLGMILVVYSLLTGTGGGIYPIGLPLYWNILYALLSFLEIVGAVLLLRFKRRSVAFVRAVMIAWVLLRTSALLYTWQKGPAEIAVSLVVISTDLVWLVYFMVSRRVKNTYMQKVS